MVRLHSDNSHRINIIFFFVLVRSFNSSSTQLPFGFLHSLTFAAWMVCLSEARSALGNCMCCIRNEKQHWFTVAAATFFLVHSHSIRSIFVQNFESHSLTSMCVVVPGVTLSTCYHTHFRIHTHKLHTTTNALTAFQLLISCHEDDFIPMLSLLLPLRFCVFVCVCDSLPRALMFSKQMHYTTGYKCQTTPNINSINICQFVWRSLFKCHTIIMINLEKQIYKHLHQMLCLYRKCFLFLPVFRRHHIVRMHICLCVYAADMKINGVDGLSYYTIHCV